MSTTLSPPVEIEVPVAFTTEGMDALLTHLNTAHGYPHGVPFDGDAPAALVDAAHNLMAVRRIRLRVTHLSADGRPTFEIAKTTEEG